MSTVALVTGGNQGLGYALVRGLCERLGPDAVVYLASRDAKRGRAAVSRLRAEGLTARAALLDVTDEAGVSALAEAVAAEHGGIDIVLSNAAARISPDVSDADQVAGFVDTNNHGTNRMLKAFVPLLRDGGRYVVVASAFGVLSRLDPRLHERFDTTRMSLEDVGEVMDGYVAEVRGGTAAASGWPDWINVASKVGQVASMRVAARDLAEGDRGIVVNAACPGLVDTAASRPWFTDMAAAKSPDDAAEDVLWLALLPKAAREPYGELVQYRAVLPWGR
ncbi:SDR family NAD(P)-dependent oxidoreductase [Phytomonospora sp. NPDC050363]|uniref:SDR family NAD(P)-dependent oxidoreductase n=1 Tax=Phytomonospora sp. NPDC050363 TaxID=3155642 RepID=UPI00340F83C4